MNHQRQPLREVLSRFATGVSIVTTLFQNRPYGLTVNAFTSVSLDPPLILICIWRNAKTHGRIRKTGFFAVNILSSTQRELSELFARKDVKNEDRFKSVTFAKDFTGAPVINHCIAYLDCKVVAQHHTGDHTIFVGEVKACRIREEEAKPLLYYKSQYYTGFST